MPYGAKVFCRACIYTAVSCFLRTDSSICSWYACKGWRRCGLQLRCFASNRHSLVAASRCLGTRRGFLLRGLYDAHPSRVIVASLACLHGRASYKPKLNRLSANIACGSIADGTRSPAFPLEPVGVLFCLSVSLPKCRDYSNLGPTPKGRFQLMQKALGQTWASPGPKLG